MLIARDIVLDSDVLALDGRATSDFGEDNRLLDDKRRVAVGQWLTNHLGQRGYPAHRHSVRRAPDAVYGQVSSVTTNYTSHATNVTADDVPLGTIFTGADATDALYVMYRAPFRGLYVGVHESVNAVAQASSPTFWAGQWTGVSSLVDDTRIGDASFARGGNLAWQIGDDWSQRVFANTFGYWAKVFVGSLTSTTAATQITPIVPSKLTYPASLYTLGLLYQDAWSSQRGDWGEKSERLFAMAETEIERVLDVLEDEFDIDNTGAVEITEVNSFRQTEGAVDLAVWERA